MKTQTQPLIHDFAEKVALVTGAASGIGLAPASRLTQRRRGRLRKSLAPLRSSLSRMVGRIFLETAGHYGFRVNQVGAEIVRPGLVRLLPLAPGGFHQVLWIPLTFDLNLRGGLFNLGQVGGCQLHVRRPQVFIETM
jgi:hypothetical protein